MYEVHARHNHNHNHNLAALREVVARFAAGSHLVRIPLLDVDEMRETVISACATRAADDLNRLAADDLNRLAADIAAAQHPHASEHVISKLYQRFNDLQSATTEHAGLPSTSLDDTNAALELVEIPTRQPARHRRHHRR